MKELCDVLLERLFDNALFGNKIGDEPLRCHVETIIAGLRVLYGEQFVAEYFTSLLSRSSIAMYAPFLIF